MNSGSAFNQISRIESVKSRKKTTLHTIAIDVYDVDLDLVIFTKIGVHIHTLTHTRHASNKSIMKLQYSAHK